MVTIALGVAEGSCRNVVPSPKKKITYLLGTYQLRTLKHLPDNTHGNLISINILEFVFVIIDYCVALTVIMTENVTDDPYPILLNIADNTSAHSWTIHTCKSSRLGKLLARLFCYLLMDSRLGISPKYIDTNDNYIADAIPRLKKLQASSSKYFSFDYSSLQQKYPPRRPRCS